jgi:CBS-domain-containing membrane protein
MQKILIEEVYQLSESASLSLPEDTPLEELVERFAHERGIRAIFLTDSRGRFSGMIRRIDLIKWIYLQLFGRTGGEKASTGEVLRLTFAKKAKDLARGDSSTMGIKPTDTLETALNNMILHGEAIIPVLDKEGKILGDLRATDVLLQTLEMGNDSPKD